MELTSPFYLNVALYNSIFIYYTISKRVFDNIFLTAINVIDEEFHIPQGLTYCNLTFNTWNPKITTLPGLYLISTIILSPFNLCSVYWLRFINLVASGFNLFLFNVYLNLYNNKTPWINLISSINLSLLPPVYFFSNLYYTDIISITFVLLIIIFYKKENHLLASLFGTMAILMRQTNIIWVGLVFGQYLFRIGKIMLPPSTFKNKNFLWSDINKIWLELKTRRIFRKVTLKIWSGVFSYLSVFIGFALFIFLNGSIVVGDKTAHSACIHLTQIFYFVIFCVIFSWQFFVTDLLHFLKHIRKKMILTLILILLFVVIIYYNTLEHPYLLADNRHYTFYIWNRFYRKYVWFRYAMIPMYYFGCYALFSKLSAFHDVCFVLTYIIFTVFAIVLQKMLEIRYFFIPFIILRLHYKQVKTWQLIFEFLSYVIINIVTLNIFFTKNIYWSDFTYSQKLIW